MKSTNNKQWFIKIRGSYLPKSWPAILIYAIYLAYLIWVLVYVLISDYDFWPATFIVFPNWLAACLAISWIASKTSKS